MERGARSCSHAGLRSSAVHSLQSAVFSRQFSTPTKEGGNTAHKGTGRIFGRFGAPLRINSAESTDDPAANGCQHNPIMH